MSKVIQKLKQVSQPLPPPIGFGAAKNAVKRPKIQLLATIGNGAASLLPELQAADALIIGAVKKNIPGLPWGLWLKKGDLVEAEKAIKAQADFVILPAQGRVLPPEMNIGKILQIDGAATDIMLRAANELPVDAFFLFMEKDAPLTWQSLITLSRFGGLLAKPVIVTVSSQIDAAGLKAIWEAGISGVLLEVNDEAGAGSLKAIREMIDGLSYPTGRKKDGISPVLPRFASFERREEIPDEDDDD